LEVKKVSDNEWLDKYGGEWLDGSGFEDEPDPED
jgi:hypothetical protein